MHHVCELLQEKRIYCRLVRLNHKGKLLELHEHGRI